MKLSIAIISDLHIGKNVRSKDLCHDPDSYKGVSDNFLERFDQFIQQQKLRPDYLILPGDVTELAQTKETEFASRIVTEVAAILGVPIERSVFVPGNHDVDWSLIKDKDDPVKWPLRYATIKHKDFVFDSIMKRGAGHLTEEPYISSWNFKNLVVVGFNSSWHDNPEELDHHGRINAEQLDALNDHLSGLDLGDDRLRIFLVHHHPIAYDSPAGEHDFSQLVGCEKLFQILNHYRFDFLVHGHTHQPRFKVLIGDSAHPLAILAAGTFSLEIPSEWHGCVANQFHVLDIERRDGQTSFVCGELRSWSYFLGRGWIPSTKEQNQICFKEPFGLNLPSEQLRTRLKDSFESLFTDRGWLKWNELVHNDQDLKFVRPVETIRILRELSGECSFALQPSIPTELDEIVFLKNDELD